MRRDLSEHTGTTYGSWTVLGRASWSLSGASTWHVMCDCGQTDIKATTELTALTMCPECLTWHAEHGADEQ